MTYWAELIANRVLPTVRSRSLAGVETPGALHRAGLASGKAMSKPDTHDENSIEPTDELPCIDDDPRCDGPDGDRLPCFTCYMAARDADGVGGRA